MKNIDKLHVINNEIKDYINESQFISNKCRNKIISMLGEEFNIKFKLDNYQTIDVILKEDGHIIMRGDEYSPDDEITSFNEVEERYNKFKERADNYLKRKDVSFENKKLSSNIINLLIVLVILIIFVLLLIYSIKAIFRGDITTCISLFIFVFCWVIPSVRENLKGRIQSAYLFIKRLFKK